MKFGAYLEYILTYCFFTGMQCTTVERHYKSSQNMACPSNAGQQITIRKRSKIECAIACREESTCISFSFDKTSGICSMSNGMIANSSDEVYCGNYGCPTELGYRLWTYADKTLCLKYESSPYPHTDAVTSCAADNAHLVVIDGDSTRLLIVDMLTALGVGTGSMDYVYVDGYDYGDQDIFRTWKGDDIWTLWSPGDNPAHRVDEDCIVGKLATKFQTIDYYCANSYPYVCQTDLI